MAQSTENDNHISALFKKHDLLLSQNMQCMYCKYSISP